MTLRELLTYITTFFSGILHELRNRRGSGPKPRIVPPQANRVLDNTKYVYSEHIENCRVHKFTRWRDNGTVDIWHNPHLDRYPSRTDLRQVRECLACGLKETRRVKL